MLYHCRMGSAGYRRTKTEAVRVARNYNRSEREFIAARFLNFGGLDKEQFCDYYGITPAELDVWVAEYGAADGKDPDDPGPAGKRGKDGESGPDVS